MNPITHLLKHIFSSFLSALYGITTKTNNFPYIYYKLYYKKRYIIHTKGLNEQILDKVIQNECLFVFFCQD